MVDKIRYLQLVIKKYKANIILILNVFSNMVFIMIFKVYINF